MGITVELQQLSPGELKKIKNDPSRFENLITGQASNQTEAIRSLYFSQGITSMDELLEKQPHLRQSGEEFLAQMEKMLFGPDESSVDASFPPSVSLDKSWHAIHFLLSGEVWTGESLLGSALMGGAEIGDERFDTGYGVPRYHDPATVSEIAANLPALEDLKKNFDPEKIAAAGIYAFNADRAAEEWDYLSYHYPKMRDYFYDAAKRGNGILLISV